MKQKNVVMVRTSSIINTSRIVKEAICLAENGYNVKVLGWDREGILNEYNSKIQSKNIIIPVHAFKEKAKYGVGIKSILKLFKFEIWLLYNLIKQVKNIDIIHACDLDTAIPARIVSKLFKKKLVYDICDYYVDSRKVPEKIRNLVEKIEINTINKSDSTIICAEQRKEQIKKANPKKCYVIFNTPKIIESEINYRIIKSDTKKIKIGYVGILQGNRLLEEIGEEIKKNNNIELHIGGFGRLQDYFAKAAKNYENIYFYGQMEYSKVLALEKDCDILFATYNPVVPNHKYSAPNKLYEAMALGKPIIVCKNTGIDKIVEQYSLGHVIEYNSNEFIKILKEYDLLKFDRDRIKKIYEDNYSWDNMEKRLHEIYKRLF